MVHKLMSKYRLKQIDLATSLGSNRVCRPDNKQNGCGLGKNVNVRSSAYEEFTK